MSDHPQQPPHPDEPERPGPEYTSYGAPQPGPPSQAPYGQAPYGQNPYGAPAYGGQPVRDHPQSTTILVLGIVALVLCGLAGPFAWVMGGRARREIQASGGQLGGMQQVTIGWVLGIIASVLMVVGLVVGVFIVAAAISTAA
jgi:hypothetical protein